MHRCFRSVDDIDIWPAAMAEFVVSGGILGPTFSTIIATQFFNLKFGDRFYFETSDPKLRFTRGNKT